MEVKGYADAATWVYGQALEPGDWHNGDLVSLHEVRQIHFVAMSLVWAVEPHPDASDAEAPGNFRQHQIAEFPGGMKPPSWTDVDHLMRDWVAKADMLTTANETPLRERLAQIHNAFERIHPFLDGNGRTGRLVLNLLSCRLG